MATEIDPRLAFKRNWLIDPVPFPFLIEKLELHHLASLAIIQLRAEHATLKAHEEAIQEAIKVYSEIAER